MNEKCCFCGSYWAHCNCTSHLTNSNDVKEVAMEKSLEKQVGGSHYQMKIQPAEYVHANGLGYLEGNVIKYVSRHKKKNGREDIEKAIHYLEMILDMEYGGKEEKGEEPSPAYVDQD